LHRAAIATTTVAAVTTTPSQKLYLRNSRRALAASKAMDELIILGLGIDTISHSNSEI
jgi:hypothetical protein